jgi:chemosensory pili system protein ChpC
MAETHLSIRSQIIPIGGGHLVLPNTAVAEVINYSEPAPIAEGPEWLLGLLSWRERDVPLLSFEVMCGQSKPSVPVRAKIVVLNA